MQSTEVKGQVLVLYLGSREGRVILSSGSGKRRPSPHPPPSHRSAEVDIDPTKEHQNCHLSWKFYGASPTTLPISEPYLVVQMPLLQRNSFLYPKYCRYLEKTVVCEFRQGVILRVAELNTPLWPSAGHWWVLLGLPPASLGKYLHSALSKSRILRKQNYL